MKKITKIGNSYGLILPSDIMELVGIKPNDQIEIRIENGGIFLHPTLTEDRLVTDSFAQFARQYDQALKKLAE